MKTVFKSLACLAALFAFLFLAAYHPEGVALAAFVPLLPRDMFGRPKINRAIDLGNGTWGAGGELLSYPLYDRLRLLNSQAVNPRSLFSSKVGSTRDGFLLTYADTNVQKSESTSSSEKYEFFQLNVKYQASEIRTDAEIQSLLDFIRTSFCRFQIDNKTDMFILPLWKFFGAMQLVSVPAVTVNSRFPQAVYMGQWAFDIPIVLESLTTYEMIIQPTVASVVGLDNDFISFEFETKKARK